MNSNSIAIATNSASVPNNYLATLDENTVAIICAVIGGLFTLFAAYVGVRAAFKQIKKQFEHKVIHTAWKELQENLFKFNSALSDYSVLILGMKYYLKSQNNPLVSGGDIHKYRNERYQEFFESHMVVQRAYVDFLISFENHEIIFLDIRKMKELFTKEMREKVEDKFMDFSSAIFPDSVGKTQTYSQTELENMIDLHYSATVDISSYLWDIRIELQNETLGKILGKSVPKREPDEKMKILTKKGWKTQKRQPKRS